MSYGFSIQTGTSSTIQYISSDTPAGVFVDSFLYVYGSGTVVKTYSYTGTLLACICNSISASWNSLLSPITVTIDQNSHTVTVNSGSGIAAGDALIMVLGI